jgi:nicotinamidase-related amidase
MRHRASIALLFAISAGVSGYTQQRAHPISRGDFSGTGESVGTLTLISRVVALEDGTAVHESGLGKTPTGYLIYDSSGHVAGQLMRLDRPMAIDCGTSDSPSSNNSQSVNGYDVYFGTYTHRREQSHCYASPLKMGFRPDLSDAGPADSPNRLKPARLGYGDAMRAPDGTEGRILIRDTWNTEIVDGLKPQSGDIVLYKTRFSGFYQTGLDNILKTLNARYLVVTGCTTSVCVESTVRDAMFRDYSCLLIADCMAEPIGNVGNNSARSNHEASLLVIQALFGWVSRSGEFIGALERRAGRTAASRA